MADFAFWLMREEAAIAESPGKWKIGDIVQVKQISPAPGTLDAGAAVDKATDPETVGIPCTGHPYSADDIININGSAGYGRTLTVDSVTTNEVVVKAPYVVETFAGTERIQFAGEISNNVIANPPNMTMPRKAFLVVTGIPGAVTLAKIKEVIEVADLVDDADESQGYNSRRRWKFEYADVPAAWNTALTTGDHSHVVTWNDLKGVGIKNKKTNGKLDDGDFV